MIRWLAKVWRRSWKRSRRPSRRVPRLRLRPTQDPLRDVVVQERGAARGCEHVIAAAGEPGAAFVLAQHRGELGEERDLADGGARLRWDAVRRDAAAAARELVPNVDDASVEVDVVPAQSEYLGEPHARVRPGEEQRPIPVRTGGEESGELGLGEDALVGAQRMRPLVALEAVEGMRGDVAAAKREREHATERPKDALDRPGRETIRLQLAHNCDDVVGCDQRQAAAAEPGQEVAVQLRAVEIECSIAPLTRCDLGLEVGEPTGCHLRKCESR